MKLCKNAGEKEDCLLKSDDKFTMDFSDIGEKPIHWCSVCGPEAHEIQVTIEKRILIEPGFKDRLKKAITKAEKK